MDSKIFNLETVIESIKNLDLLSVVDRCHSEYKAAELVMSANKQKEWTHNIVEYRDHLRDFVYFMTNNAIPYNTGKEGMRKFRLVVENLVLKGHKPPEVLRLLD